MRARLVAALAVAFLGLQLAGCCVNTIPTEEERAKASWSEVLNQYQRRADLIPNLVETVKGYAAQEKDVLTSVVEARAKATSVKVDASTITDPEAFKKFQDAQAQLSGVLGRLLVPGRQPIGMLVTILVGIVAAFIGTAIARAIGIPTVTNGIDWLELLVQVIVAALGVALVSALMGRRRTGLMGGRRSGLLR